MQFQYVSMKTGYENRQADQFKSVISKKDKIVFLIFRVTYDSQRGGGGNLSLDLEKLRMGWDCKKIRKYLNLNHLS